MTSGPISTIRPSGAQSRIWWLAVLLVLSEAFYIWIFKISFVKDYALATRFVALLGVLFFLYGVSFLLVRSGTGQQRNALFVIAAGAVLFRITLLGVGIGSPADAHETLGALGADVRGESVEQGHFFLFDDDLWRYLWDGHVSASGMNPYQYPPNATEFDKFSTSAKKGHLWHEIRAKVNHPYLPTVYPPMAQLVFRFSHGIAPGSILVFKSIVCLLDLVAVLFIAMTLRALNCSMARVVLYAWNPLVITMVAGSGHIDALAAATISATAYFLARKKPEMAAVSFALSIAAKLAPIVLVFLIAKRLRWRGMVLSLLVLIGIYLPFFHGAAVWKNLGIYVYTWQFNSAWFHSLDWLLSFFSSDPSYMARVLSGVIILLTAMWLAFRDQGNIERFFSSAAATMGVFLVLNPTVMPWYVVWLLPLAVIAKQQIWIYFSALISLSVFMMMDWQPQPRVLALEYGIFLLLIGWKCYKILVGRDKAGRDKVGRDKVGSDKLDSNRGQQRAPAALIYER